ncbi:unknown protein [Oryza sativa Japonica Group]|uniref:Os01g0745400 protein n=2 Tax=Oryza sativa subsp. japonica TaxID=39947 RepID=B9EZM7_ORYSJ|nr:hypothetical protein OsJ_03428 [Oryza sativa Japonica Group]KAB8083480.1 hypothetical protein EE612_005683 [Oryza sativa]BAD87524.1 unknown protein [Oryza sativa Japonica Group]BAH91295.1 Os01g0745400 [Oryza sativa Japonica Group]BAS74313.1 Os01g0745400 [Oryza sativa Japonica Group]|eukprot:NP_001172565.1 Os01g0745400 [Oryza sativa Japonica Group]
MATISETLPNSEAVSHAYKFASTWEKVGFLASLRGRVGVWSSGSTGGSGGSDLI